MSHPKGFILLRHPVHVAIRDDELVQGLSDDELRLPYQIASIAISEPIPIEESANLEWETVAAREERIVRQTILPAADAAAGYEIIYYGVAPIPLAIRAGYLIDDARRVGTRLLHHEHKTWNWQGGDKPEVLVDGLPTELVDMPGDAIVSVSVSYEIDHAHALRLVPQHLANVRLRVNPISRDAVKDAGSAADIAAEFRDLLDRLMEVRPNIETIHLFVAAPTGICFLLGHQIRPTIHPRVQTYHYVRMADPRYSPAVLLDATEIQVEPLTEPETETASKVRAVWAKELEAIGAFSNTLSTEAADWLSQALPGEQVEDYSQEWRRLARLTDTAVRDSCVSDEPLAGREAFFYRPGDNAWQFEDRFLSTIATQLADDDRVARAGRLLVLHESAERSGRGSARWL